MNHIHPNKLRQSKWTAVQPHNKEKHFMITAVRCDAAGNPKICVLEAVHSHREMELDWHELKDDGQWQTGWR